MQATPAQQRNPRIETECDRALRMMREGASRREVLTHLAAAAEHLAGPHCVASILVLDEHGLLRNGASPNLPADYLDAIDRLKPHPELGTFGTYYRVRREPTPEERDGVQALASVAALVLQAP